MQPPLPDIDFLRLHTFTLPNQDLNVYQKTVPPSYNDASLLTFDQRLRQVVELPLFLSYSRNGATVIVAGQINHDVVVIEFSTKRFRSPTTYIFILWMIGTSILLVAVSITFMRNQIKSILKLAEAADTFGKGLNVDFEPSGSKEIRMAGRAFIKMKKRIEHQIRHRTELLAHISHDLRTPLTSLKLQLALLADSTNPQAIVEAIDKHVIEMERMVKGYLNFAKGEGNEEVVSVDIVTLLHDALLQYKDARIELKQRINSYTMFIRPQAIKRACSNILNNAIQHAKDKIVITITKRLSSIYIIIDDDGKGIKRSMYQAAFSAFHRLDESKDGYGLGLAIVKSIVQSHGGQVRLAKSPYNGLRVVVSLPV
ncbi:sensor histidine kinase [Rickettsiales endosymbiont of Peranema trichophorum]|uniref:sensor histidine kinase n=1 Tax=Rickettsiales endosymbiont of Peranema trichophorum TaxID=2486577 RepID=UPI0013EE4141|nr:HAMP domain-containing sensor histidine kinase [Rickettsiales endosymbiont of Peranema trichophorum]